MIGVYLHVFVPIGVIAALLVAALWAWMHFTGTGRHAGEAQRDAETAALFASMNRPPEIAHEKPPPGFLPAPPPVPVVVGVPVPPPRERHTCGRGCRLPAVPPALAGYLLLTHRLTTVAPRVAADMRRLEDEARYPWLRSGQYADRTGDFTARDREMVLAALAQASAS